MAIDATIGFSVVINDRRAIGLAPNVNVGVNATPSVQFANGTGAGQVDKNYHATRTFSGATDDLDLTGVLTDAFGGTITEARIKTLYIKNNSTTNTIVLGNATSNAWATLLGATHTLTLRPGAIFQVTCDANDVTGWAVTAATGDIFRLTGTSGQTYDIALLGCSV